MSQDIPITGYAILGLLTFGDELTGYEIKQRADVTLRFYWVSPAMSQIYTELRRLSEHGLVTADARQDGGRVVQHVVPGDPRRATGRAGQGRHHPDRGRLAGTVGPQEAEHRPPGHREADTVDGRRLAELLDEVDRLDRVIVRH